MERIEVQRNWNVLKPIADFLREEATHNNYTERLREVFKT